MATARASRPMLAGVCSRLAAMLRWNPWGMRLAFVLLLLFKPLLALLSYLALAVGFRFFGDRPTRAGTHRRFLRSPELAARARRIAELDRRLGGD